MDLREPAPIPAAFDFTRFLVSSITFMAHLREVSVYFDDKRLAHLTKDAGDPKRLPIPQGLRPTSPMGFMNIKGLKSTRDVVYRQSGPFRADHRHPLQPCTLPRKS
jgi:hypothetical protein